MPIEVQNLIAKLPSEYRKRHNEHGIKTELTTKMFQMHPNIARSDAIRVLRECLDMSHQGASTYYQNHRPREVHMEEPQPEEIVVSSKEEFLNQPLVSRFTENISQLITGAEEFKHSYEIVYPPWSAAMGSHWECKDLPTAMKSYWWNGTLQENSNVLDSLAEKLKKSIKNGQSDMVFPICIKILDWGGVYRGSIGYLIEKYESDSLIGSIKEACEVLDGSRLNVDAFENKRLRMDSAMTKIYSLYCEKSIIYDDRVASAITLIAHRLGYSQEDRTTLRGLKIFGRGEKEKQRINDEMSYGVTTRNHARFNLLANWIVNDSIEKAKASDKESVKNKWKTEFDIPLRRKVEAALFMIGSDISAG